MKAQKLANGAIRIDAARYSLELRLREALAFLVIKGTHQKHLFFPGGAFNPAGKRDETLAFGPVSVKAKGGVITLTFAERSSLWKGKRHTWVCAEESIEVFYELRGRGKIERAHYFRGYFAGSERGFASEMDEVFSTCPNFQEKLFFHPGESFTISTGSNLELSVGCQAMASPCFCVGLHDRCDKAFWSVGLAALPGNYTWDSFQWNPPWMITTVNWPSRSESAFPPSMPRNLSTARAFSFRFVARSWRTRTTARLQRCSNNIAGS